MAKLILDNNFREIPWSGISWYKDFMIEDGKMIDFQYFEGKTIIEIPENKKELVVQCEHVRYVEDPDEKLVTEKWKAIFRIRKNKLILKDILEFNEYNKKEISEMNNSEIRKVRKNIKEDIFIHWIE